MNSVVCLACEDRLPVIMQQNAKQHAIANMHFRPMCSELMGKISVAGSVYAVSAAVRENGNCRGLYTVIYVPLTVITVDSEALDCKV